MKSFCFLLSAAIATLPAAAQKTVQSLQPTRLGIFKNGTFFVKKEVRASVTDQAFYLPAPQNVLMGTYWLSVSNEAAIRSVTVKPDTVRIQRAFSTTGDYMTAYMGKSVVLFRDLANGVQQRLGGKLLDYNDKTGLIKVQTDGGSVIVTRLDLYNQMELAGAIAKTYGADSLIATAKVQLDKPVSNIMAATVSLEKGLQWYASYLLRIVNDKEARLEMKATIVNNSTDYLNTPVDIIIGTPEMFYGNQLDPACTNYLLEGLLDRSFRDNRVLLNANFSNVVSQSVNYNDLSDGDGTTDTKDGQSADDLYYYQLGQLDLPKDARVMVPVMSTTVKYEDIYTANLDLKSTEVRENKVQDVYHSYRIGNTTAAPFTTGAVLVLNKAEQALAQSEMRYTPVKGTNEIRLSRALNVQVKNEEVEIKREKAGPKNAYGNAEYEKITSRGNVIITNYSDKKITIRVSKMIEGVLVKQDNGGTNRKVRDEGEDEIVTLLNWEVTVEPGAKKILGYDYYTLK